MTAKKKAIKPPVVAEVAAEPQVPTRPGATMTVNELRRLVGEGSITRQGLYGAVLRGEIESVRIGKRVLVIVDQPFVRKLVGARSAA
jgi:hypothetical protein